MKDSLFEQVSAAERHYHQDPSSFWRGLDHGEGIPHLLQRGRRRYVRKGPKSQESLPASNSTG